MNNKICWKRQVKRRLPTHLPNPTTDPLERAVEGLLSANTNVSLSTTVHSSALGYILDRLKAYMVSVNTYIYTSLKHVVTEFKAKERGT